MGVLIGIDFGKKRTGLAHTDPQQMIASGLTTVETHKAIAYLSDYQNITPIEKFVVGQPKQKNGNFSKVEKDILIFINQIKMKFPTTTIVRQDERFTSKMAFNSLIQTGAKRKVRKNKSIVDEISATLILQSYLLSNSKTVV
jgi:putative Holliday junction resolvase